ncbi:MAG: hypothetical protein EBZ48_03760 [Proteobacteria bacterium]|nr:hypothetical protein [Pseudomonadota bacterium]
MHWCAFRQNRWSFFLGTLLLAATFLWLRSVFWRFNPDTLVFTDDLTVSIAVARLFLNGEHTLLGPPCHVAGRHLGPIYYWYLSLLLWMAREDVLRMAILCTIAKLCAAGIVVWSLRFFLSRSALLLGSLCAILVLSSGQFLWILRKSWHMHFMLLPATALFVVTFLCIYKGPRYFLAFMLCCCLLVQTHFGASPVAVGLAAVLLLRWIKESREEGHLGLTPWRALCRRVLLESCSGYRWMWGVLALLSWLPLALYEYRYPSNLFALWGVHKHQIEGSGGLDVAWNVFYQFSRKLLIGTNPVTDLIGAERAFVRLALILCTGISGGLLFWSYIRRATSEQRWCLGALLVPCIGMFAALSAARPPVYLYYLNPLLPVVPILAGLVLGHAATIVAESFGPTGTSTSRHQVWKALSIGAAMFIPFGYLKTRDLSTNVRQFRAHFGASQNLSHALHVSTLLAANTPSNTEIRIEAGERTGQSKNGYYYFLKGQPLWLMNYSKYFHELPSFHRTKRGHHTGVPPQRARYVVTCSLPGSGWYPLFDHSHLKRPGLQFGERWSVPSSDPKIPCEVIRLVSGREKATKS